MTLEQGQKETIIRRKEEEQLEDQRRYGQNKFWPGKSLNLIHYGQ